MMLFSIILVLFSTIFVNVLSECNVNIKDDLLVKAPVFLHTTGKLLSPDGPSLKWKIGEESNLLCSGPSNSLTKEDAQEMIIKCESNNKFSTNGKNTNIGTLECKNPNTATILNKNIKCLNSGTIHEIGFQTTKSGFIKYIDVCYNLNIGSIVYTHHIIPGKSIDDSISEPNRPTFSTNGIPKLFNMNKSYKKIAQEARFAELLGKEMVSTYISSKSYLARGHLTPDNDGIFRSWKGATYFYMNVAPQWQSVNAQNWIRVENLARKKASALKDDLEIYTGNFGILSLKNNNGKLVDISLESNGNIPVPKYYWKILKYKKTGIAFITLNNPFATNEKQLCNDKEDICSKYQWPNTDFDLYEKGKTYCCTVKDLLKVFKDVVPKEADVDNVMSFN